MRHATFASITFVSLIAASALAACSRQAETPPPAAPSQTAAPASDEFKTFTVGELSAIALRDGALEFPNDNQTFGVGQPQEEMNALLTAAGLPTDQLHLSLQPLLVKTPDRVLLFDTGAGSNMGASGGHLPSSLAAAGVDPESVTDIFISHMHGDHVGGLLNAEGQAAFPNAAIHLSAPEWAFLKSLNADSATRFAITRYDALIAAIAPKVVEFAPDAEILPGLVKAVEIRGHTPGHSGYLITSGGSSLLYIGDAMHHSVISVQKPDWKVNFDSDASTAAASRDELLSQSAASGQRLYAVHFPFPGLGKVERRAGEFVWVPE